MKKTILLLLCFLMLFGIAACGESGDIGSESGEDKQSDINTSSEITIVPTTSTSNVNLVQKSPQLEFYMQFEEAVAANVYDIWLEQVLAEGKQSEYSIYSDYLTLWKDELTYTIENGKKLFDSEEDYTHWKNKLNEWLENSQALLKIEMNQMMGTLSQVDIIIPYCQLVRQKVIDTKKFLYYLEDQTLSLQYIYDRNISVTWKYSND